MKLVRKASLGPGRHECAFMSYALSERDATWIELLLAEPQKVSFAARHVSWAARHRDNSTICSDRPYVIMLASQTTVHL